MVDQHPEDTTGERLAFTLNEFCRAVGFTRAGFYGMPPDKRPRSYVIGGRRYVSRESALAWIRAREAAEPSV